MKNTYIYLTVIAALGLASCEPEFDQPLEDTPVVTQESGSADFSNYVAIGASITAGFADGALFIEGQDVAFPKLLANQMEAAGGGEFTTPYMDDNYGGFTGFEDSIGATRLVLSGNPLGEDAAPVRVNDNVAQNDISKSISGAYNNMGVPSLKSFHIYGDTYAAANPYFGRFASSSSATVMGDALAQSPTFYSLWLGGNDVLGYATSGGTGVDQTDLTVDATAAPDFSAYGNDDITNPVEFNKIIATAIGQLNDSGASGVVFNVPAVTDLPYFTRVPFNPIPMDEATAAATNAAYATYNQTLAAINAGLTALPAAVMSDEELAKRTINFSAGQNAVVIFDDSLTDLTVLDPSLAALISIRQATAEDLLVLTSGSFIGSLADPNDPSSVNGVGIPLADEWVLTPEEQTEIANATTAYNTTIAALAGANENLMMFDANALLNELSTTGLSFDGGTIFAALGSAFSFDGIHLSPRGNAVFANAVIEDMNAYFGSTLKLTDPISFKTATLE